MANQAIQIIIHGVRTVNQTVRTVYELFESSERFCRLNGFPLLSVLPFMVTFVYIRSLSSGYNLPLNLLSMLDSPLILWVKLPVVDRIQPQSNKFAVGVENIRLQVTQNLMAGMR